MYTQFWGVKIENTGKQDIDIIDKKQPKYGTAGLKVSQIKTKYPGNLNYIYMKLLTDQY